MHSKKLNKILIAICKIITFLFRRRAQPLCSKRYTLYCNHMCCSCATRAGLIYTSKVVVVVVVETILVISRSCGCSTSTILTMTDSNRRNRTSYITLLQ